MFKRINSFTCRPDQSKTIHLEEKTLMELPALPDRGKNGRNIRALSVDQQQRFDCSLDGALAIGIPRPNGIEEERQFVERFLAGIQKLFSINDNWTLLQPLLLTLNYCASCQTCSDACPVYAASGGQEVYRPTYRSDLFRAIVARHVNKGGKWLARIRAGDVDLNWRSIARLAELCYRCTLCRRCTQICPLGIDNALITHELRKVFSQEMGIAPKEIHQLGTVQQLQVGSTTGMRPKAFEDVKNFMEEEIHEKTGRRISIPVDKKGADILLIHNAGEFISWPENPEAFAIIFEAAGLSWTLSSQLLGYDGVNYGVWYDDFQFTRIARRHAEVAKELGVSRIVIGECGHSHKASIVMADGLFPADLQIPHESCLPLLEKIVFSGKFRLNPGRNDFPLTLHDPCNITRMMGIVSPQRKILREICPGFREMEPHGTANYCCGGGGGLAVISSFNFSDWRTSVAGRMKVKQIMAAFEDVPAETSKYVCAPCSNCKAQLRDLFEHYNLGTEWSLAYTGLAELIVNAMSDLPEGFLS